MDAAADHGCAAVAVPDDAADVIGRTAAARKRALACAVLDRRRIDDLAGNAADANIACGDRRTFDLAFHGQIADSAAADNTEETDRRLGCCRDVHI